MKYIGLDLGSVTCGISKSDTGRFAMAVKTLRFKPDDYNAAFDMLLDYFEEEKPDVIVLGYPLLENGDEGPRASLSREFGEQSRASKSLCRMKDVQPEILRSFLFRLVFPAKSEKRSSISRQLSESFNIILIQLTGTPDWRLFCIIGL